MFQTCNWLIGSVSFSLAVWLRKQNLRLSEIMNKCCLTTRDSKLKTPSFYDYQRKLYFIKLFLKMRFWGHSFKQNSKQSVLVL